MAWSDAARAAALAARKAHSHQRPPLTKKTKAAFYKKGIGVLSYNPRAPLSSKGKGFKKAMTARVRAIEKHGMNSKQYRKAHAAYIRAYATYGKR